MLYYCRVSGNNLISESPSILAFVDLDSAPSKFSVIIDNCV